jgi:hypothetical protein
LVLSQLTILIDAQFVVEVFQIYFAGQDIINAMYLPEYSRFVSGEIQELTNDAVFRQGGPYESVEQNYCGRLVLNLS